MARAPSLASFDVLVLTGGCVALVLGSCGGDVPPYDVPPANRPPSSTIVTSTTDTSGAAGSFDTTGFGGYAGDFGVGQSRSVSFDKKVAADALKKQRESKKKGAGD